MTLMLKTRALANLPIGVSPCPYDKHRSRLDRTGPNAHGSSNAGAVAAEPYLRHTCSMHNMHATYMQHTCNMHVTHLQHKCSMHTPYMCSMHAAYVRHMHNMSATYMQDTSIWLDEPTIHPNMRAACMQRACNLHAAVKMDPVRCSSRNGPRCRAQSLCTMACGMRYTLQYTAMYHSHTLNAPLIYSWYPRYAILIPDVGLRAAALPKSNIIDRCHLLNTWPNIRPNMLQNTSAQTRLPVVLSF